MAPSKRNNSGNKQKLHKFAASKLMRTHDCYGGPPGQSILHGDFSNFEAHKSLSQLQSFSTRSSPKMVSEENGIKSKNQHQLYSWKL